jgi:sterol desaturase/sphingolipid hydroxylase (fatty acid hydroxylase superfamily)
MIDLLYTFFNSIYGTAHWVYKLILLDQSIPWQQNYFYGLILLSLFVWGLEICFPWRKNQKIFRKDFWLDSFYMFFNFFIFAIFISGFFSVLEHLFGRVGMTMSSLALIDLSPYPAWIALLIFFVINDFVQWFTHIMLHRYEFLWRFHKVHHSVEEMGFAAHLRYHWMENLFYKPMKTLAVMIVGGFEPTDAYLIHFITVFIGHLNHANIRLTFGPLKYILNNPVMHLYHHAKELPDGQMPGVNFGISLSLWDYIFGTNYIPQDKDGTYPLGFDGLEDFPKTFWGQISYGFGPSSKPNSPPKE